uniref:Uncharacterized protein n=1 Tax=Cyprinodon variegatus TaxID=28743 RepID=A0A3Q2GLD0_CYPVA
MIVNSPLHSSSFTNKLNLSDRESQPFNSKFLLSFVQFTLVKNRYLISVLIQLKKILEQRCTDLFYEFTQHLNWYIVVRALFQRVGLIFSEWE